MATPTLTTGFTILSTCDAATGWSAGTVDTEVVKQGTASLSGILRTAGLNTRTFTATTFDATGKHLRLWLNYASIGFLDTKANGGIRLFAQDTGGAIGYWYLSGKDTYDGGWVLLTVDMDRAFDSGSATRTIINRVGFSLNLIGAPRNATNTWYDYLVYGNGLIATGGTSGDPITLEGIYQADFAAGYGAVTKKGSVYFASTNLEIGGAGTTYFKDDNQILVFDDLPVNSNLYKIEPLGAGTTTFELKNSTIKSASTATRFDLSMNNAGLDSLVFNNNIIVNADISAFKAGQIVTGCVFNGCNRIEPSTSDFTACNIYNSPSTNGALLIVASHGVTDCAFEGNVRATQINAAGTYIYSAMTFTSNTYDIHNSSTGAVIVQASGGTDATTSINSNGGTTSIQSSIVMTIAANLSLLGAEIRVYDLNNSPAGSLGTELSGIESCLGSTFQHSDSVGNVFWIQIMLDGYEEFGQSVTMPSANSTFTAILKPDINA